jgi:hypothetical protein
MAEIGAQPGNQNARKGRIWTEAIKRALARYSAKCGDAPPSVDAGLDRLADKIVSAADSGDQDAVAVIEKIGDRLEGKPAMVVAGSEDLPPVQVQGRISLVKPETGE